MAPPPLQLQQARSFRKSATASPKSRTPNTPSRVNFADSRGTPGSFRKGKEANEDDDDEPSHELYVHSKGACKDYAKALSWAKEMVQSFEMSPVMAAQAAREQFKVAISAEGVRMATKQATLPRGYPLKEEGVEEALQRCAKFEPILPKPPPAAEPEEAPPGGGTRSRPGSAGSTKPPATPKAPPAEKVPATPKAGGANKSPPRSPGQTSPRSTGAAGSPAKAPSEKEPVVLEAEDKDIYQWIFACTAPTGPFSRAGTAVSSKSRPSTSQGSCRPFTRGLFSRGSEHYM
mmetsp:Transcript_28381/g.62147  ORF Transcript_28381/g.62147 Transcript_28381/m.62147 type:complete len:289 (-) Transcript_28381:237-1103(-)|eukprot:CAMPEP_0118957618 /NCGR_PEP_ID=MMETSP1169-20130426/62199_1 /TAXON_ID=36882 /ORGANISM="Pyramimonas obovata, Strain CCMP722" /LENGTH=288 /DNA_ID=CAMNT_0006905707 /DNA_START=421 /DNA_END=1287 /DNA_ORIENTATION=+